MSVEVCANPHSSEFSSSLLTPLLTRPISRATLPPSHTNSLIPVLADLNLNLPLPKQDDGSKKIYPPGLGFPESKVHSARPALHRRTYSLRTIPVAAPVEPKSSADIKPTSRPDSPPPPSPQGNPSGQFPTGRPRSATFSAGSPTSISIGKFDPFSDDEEPSVKQPEKISLPSPKPTLPVRRPRDPSKRMACLDNLVDKDSRFKVVTGVLFDRKYSPRSKRSKSVRRTLMKIERELGLAKGTMYLKSKLSHVVSADDFVDDDSDADDFPFSF